MDGVPLREQPLDPGHELPWREALRRPQRGVIVLRHDHVRLGMNIEPELDHRGLVLSLGAGDRGCGRPFGMNDCLFIHKAGELPSSPAFFHVIYALQRTAPCVTAPASAAAFPHRLRRPPKSLSLGSLERVEKV